MTESLYPLQRINPMYRRILRITNLEAEQKRPFADLLLINEMDLWYIDKRKYHPFPFSTSFKMKHDEKVRNISPNVYNLATNRFYTIVDIVNYPTKK